MSGLGPDTGDPVGRRPGSPPHFTTAENVNPPLPGDPGYEDYVARRGALMLWLDQQRMTKPGIELSLVHPLRRRGAWPDGDTRGSGAGPRHHYPSMTSAVRRSMTIGSSRAPLGRLSSGDAPTQPTASCSLNSTVMSSASTIAAADGSPSIATVGMSMTSIWSGSSPRTPMPFEDYVAALEASASQLTRQLRSRPHPPPRRS